MKLKKSVKKKIVLFLIILLAGVGIFLYLKFFNVKKVKKVKVVSEIKEYGYVLKDSKNKAYQDEYKNLEKILSEKNIDEKKYAESISKLFIIDFFSLSDKMAKTDVGGGDFVHKDALEDFLEKAQNTMYKYVESNLYGDRKQSLPSVSSVTVNKCENVTFKYGEVTDDKAYEVNLSWKYTDESGSGYQTTGTVTLVHDGKKIVVVQLQK